jgi:hypothetical protein
MASSCSRPPFVCPMRLRKWSACRGPENLDSLGSAFAAPLRRRALLSRAARWPRLHLSGLSARRARLRAAPRPTRACAASSAAAARSGRSQHRARVRCVPERRRSGSRPAGFDSRLSTGGRYRRRRGPGSPTQLPRQPGETASGASSPSRACSVWRSVERQSPHRCGLCVSCGCVAPRGAYGVRTALQVARFSARGLHRGLHAATFSVPGRHEFRDPSCG